MRTPFCEAAAKKWQPSAGPCEGPSYVRGGYENWVLCERHKGVPMLVASAIGLRSARADAVLTPASRPIRPTDDDFLYFDPILDPIEERQQTEYEVAMR